MAYVLAIDPGPELSAWVLYREPKNAADPGRVVDYGHEPNADVPIETNGRDAGRIAIEMIQSYGMRVGREVFETCVWIGRFEQRAENLQQLGVEVSVERIDRATVKLHVCGNRLARDADVRAALIDKWGGKEAAIGTKKKPGPLYGVTGDVWAALAVAVANSQHRREQAREQRAAQ